MKKIFICVIAAAMLALTACNSQDLTFSGAYWNSNPQNKGVSAIEEELTYKVTTESKPEFSSTEASGGSLSLEISDGSKYTAKLSVDGGNYVYETTLNISGKYAYDGGEYAVTDDVTYTKTVFKGLENGLMPISAKRIVKNVYPTKAEPTSAADFAEIGYEMDIVYGAKAEITVTPDEKSKDFFSSLAHTIDDFKKTTFFDEDEMIFALRAMKLTDGCNFVFGTIDGLSGEYRSIKAEDIATATNEGERPLTPITINNYRENGRLLEKKNFNAYGVAFKTTGSYVKTFRYVYYAINPTEENTTRQIPVKIYQPMLYGGGRYLCFTLAEAKLG